MRLDRMLLGSLSAAAMSVIGTVSTCAGFIGRAFGKGVTGICSFAGLTAIIVSGDNQIWVFPNQKNVKPRYDQVTLNLADRHNQLQQVLSPDPEDAGDEPDDKNVKIDNEVDFEDLDLDDDDDDKYFNEDNF